MSLYPNKTELLSNLFRYSMIAHGYRSASVVDLERLQRDWRNYPLIVEMLRELPPEPSSPEKIDAIIRWIIEAIKTLSY